MALSHKQNKIKQNKYYVCMNPSTGKDYSQEGSGMQITVTV